MASNKEEDLDPEEQEAMLRQIQDLQLQQKRMQALVAQRREERSEMDRDLARMERMKKHMEAMCKENLEVKESEKKAEEAKKPFSGKGHVLGAPSTSKSISNTSSHFARPIVPPPPPVKVDSTLPTTNIQVK